MKINSKWRNDGTESRGKKLNQIKKKKWKKTNKKMKSTTQRTNEWQSYWNDSECEIVQRNGMRKLTSNVASHRICLHPVGYWDHNFIVSLCCAFAAAPRCHSECTIYVVLLFSCCTLHIYTVQFTKDTLETFMLAPYTYDGTFVLHVNNGIRQKLSLERTPCSKEERSRCADEENEATKNETKAT